MRTISLFATFSMLALFFFTSCQGETKTSEDWVLSANEGIEVIQFHSEHRCITCNKIENLARKTLENQDEIKFSLINVDDPDNESIAEYFEAAGTALFLYDNATRKKIDLTDFAFMQANDSEAFMAGLKKEIEGFRE